MYEKYQYFYLDMQVKVISMSLMLNDIKIGFNFSDNESSSQLVHPEILRIMYGLFVQGRNSFEEIKLFRYDPFFKQAFDLKYVPAAETLRLYL